MIFYFSATGNSQYAAEKIADSLGDRLISIGSALRDQNYIFDISGDTRLLFVVPTFAGTLPGPVALFIEKLQLTGYANQYVCGVFTCGGNSGNESSALGALLKAKGLPYNGSFDLIMPDNFIIWSEIPTGERLESILHNADESLTRIIDAIREKKSEAPSTETPKDLFMPMETISSSKNTSKFYAESTCIACGLCMELCPMRCIKADDRGRPQWEGECSMCLACLHRCPVNAIQYGSDTQGKKRYINPNVVMQTKTDS